MNNTLIHTETDSCRLLTDRWGESQWFDNTPEDLSAAERLLPYMAGEESFIVKKGGHYGILIEIEFEHSESGHITNDCETTSEEIFQSIFNRCAANLEKYSGVEFWGEVGPHIYLDRLAFRAFIPEFNKEMLEKSEEIYQEMLG